MLVQSKKIVSDDVLGQNSVRILCTTDEKEDVLSRVTSDSM